MIKLDDIYYIDSYEYGYQLLKWYGKSEKTGEDLYKTIGYCQSLEHALSIYIKEKQKKFVNDNNVNIMQALNEFKKINNEVKKLLKEICKSEKVVKDE